MIDFVILTWNSENYIVRCIDSIFADAKNSNLEIEVFVVDNGSVDKTVETLKVLQRKYSGINIIALNKNYGTTISRNIALRKIKGDYILILDSDTEVKKGCLSELITTIESDDKIGIVSPRLFYSDGKIQYSCKKFPTLLVKLFKSLPISKINKIGELLELYEKDIYLPEYKRITEVDYCISAAWLIRREAFNEVGLLDENIFYAPEDVDYCLRMWLNGWKVIYDPKASVVHYTQRISHKNFRMALVHAKGLFYYFLKYKYLFSRKRIYNQIKKNFL